MIDHDARLTDLHPFMQRSVTPDPLPTPMLRCPRCEREVDLAPLLPTDIRLLRIIDPFYTRYDLRASDEPVLMCGDCDRQVEEIADALLAYRQRLTRLWPRPAAPRGRLMDDQCLSRPFEDIRDLHIEHVLGWAVWYDQRGQDASLVVYETGEWIIQPVPRGHVYDDPDDRGSLALPIPVAPPAADARREDDAASSDNGDASSEAAGDAGDARAGSTLREFDAAAFFRRRAPSDADREALERDLATRFYRTLYA